MERSLIAEAITHNVNQCGAMLAPWTGDQRQATAEEINKRIEEEKTQRTKYQKRQEAAAIVAIAEALVTTHNTDPKVALTTATDLWREAAAFVAAWTE